MLRRLKLGIEGSCGSGRGESFAGTRGGRSLLVGMGSPAVEAPVFSSRMLSSRLPPSPSSSTTGSVDPATPALRSALRLLAALKVRSLAGSSCVPCFSVLCACFSASPTTFSVDLLEMGKLDRRWLLLSLVEPSSWSFWRSASSLVMVSPLMNFMNRSP